MRHSQLHAFHHVALHGGFSRASEVLRVAQPSLSDHVRKLEQAHDVLLFHRGARQVRLTDEGEALFRLTRDYFEAEEKIADHLTYARAEVAGSLRILTDSALHVTGLVAAFRKAHPKVSVTLRTGNAAEVLAGVQRYEAEVGVVGSDHAPPDMDVVTLGASPIRAIVAARSPEARAVSLTLGEIAAHPLVFREQGSRPRAVLEAAAKVEGVRLRPKIEAEGREAVRELVAAGAGIGFIAEAELRADPRIAVVPIAAPGLDMSEALIVASARREVRVIRAFLGVAETAR